MVPLQISKSWQACPPVHTVTTASFSRVACLSLWMATLFRRNVVTNSNMIQLHLGVWPSHSVWCQLLPPVPRIPVSGSSTLFPILSSILMISLNICPSSSFISTFKQYIILITYTISYLGNWWNLVVMNLHSVVRKTNIVHVYPPLSLVYSASSSNGKPKFFYGKISIKQNQTVTHSELSINVNFYYVYYF